MNWIIIQMERLQQNQTENQDSKPLPIRVKHPHWQVRKRAYQEIYANLQNISSVKEQLSINNEVFSANKLSPLLNNIVEQKHPIILSKGLQCVLKILEIKNSMIKHFHKLVVQGLQKLPILTHQKNQILHKFMEILGYLRQQSSFIATLNSKLSSPNQKVVHFIIQVIGALELSPLKKKLIQISKKHPKKDIKDQAAEVVASLADNQDSTDFKQQQTVKSTRPTVVKKQIKKEQTKRSLQILDKLHQYDQIKSKEQQKYTEDLLQAINQIALLPNTPQLSNFCYYIQLMIEDNNQIISMNGVKMLTTLIRLRSQLIPLSFPLLFVLRKFKMHKTHSTNANLLKLTDQLLCSTRSTDLMNAVFEGISNIEPKVNLRYGCIMTFVRTFCYFYREHQMFVTYCLGEYEDLFDRIENKKQVQKVISKCFQSFKKDKQRQYQPMIQKMKDILGVSQFLEQKIPRTVKNINNRSESGSRFDKQKITQKSEQNLKTQLIPKGPSKASSKTTFDSLVTPQGQLNKIMQLVNSQKCNQSILKKAIQKCLKCTETAINGQIFDLFYFCQIAQSFIDQYQSNQQLDHIISQFLISYLIKISSIKIKEGKKNSKIVQKGIEYVLKISVAKLVLSKQITTILDNIREQVNYEVILISLGNFLVMGGQCPKKKNKKYLIRWLEQNTSEQFLNNYYFQLREAIQSNGQKKQKKEIKQKILPPSVINLPTYQQLKGNSSQTKFEENQNSNFTNKIQVANKIKLQQVIKQEVKMSKQALQNLQISQVNIKQNEDHQNFSSDQQEQIPGRENHDDFQLNLNIQQQLKNQKKQKGTKYYYQPSQQQQEEQKYHQNNQPLLVKEYNHYIEESQKMKVQNDYEADSEQQESHFEQHQQHQDKNLYIFQYKYLDQKRILYMLSNSGKSFSHLRTLVLNPFKKQSKKHQFLRELTHLIQNQKIAKPEPYKSLLLLVIVLFGQIKTDKTIIQPLQALYEFMAQHCSNNQFLKNIIGLYHCVIEETEENQRKFLLTILTKSMNRMMPYVQNPIDLLRDFQQFYQIGQLVYFQMYPEEYQQIKQMVQKSESLNDVLIRAYQQEKENMTSIVEGWLQSGFKRVIKSKLEQFIEEDEDNE